ncbi:hypothetical protein PoB_003334600 [Plakobranchus ocellatus]|uniref:Uncharacterized protein n=1 Tax=Plakobranchus ocellatus TaxID=259542 RepID=A0AAV4AJQ3_9GAST|nr:hypothetical protein PoB_003334600 [Plakobranchus ocellatus]
MATLVFTIAQNFDWEDMAYGPCADGCRQNMCNWAEPDAESLMVASDSLLLIICKVNTGRAMIDCTSGGMAWAPDGKGFYVISRGEDPMIYYYPKDDVDTIGPGV